MKTPRLKWNANDARGDVVLPDDWQQRHYIERADALKDWIFHLKEIYNATLKEGK